MSVTESKVKTPRKSSAKVKAAAEKTEVQRILENAEVRLTCFSRMFISDLNVRTIPHTETEIRELADSIKAMGILQNLIAVECDDGRVEIVGGGGRTKAVSILVEEGLIAADLLCVPYKAVPRELARAASMTENGKHKQMHPAEQIAGFRALAEEGRTPAQIGDLLGYGSRHVQRMLKLSDLAPSVLNALAKNEITTEHCQALALESDQQRQAEVLEIASKRGWNNKPAVDTIRSLITSEEVSTNSKKYQFVGTESFTPEEVRIDLFSAENGGFVKSSALDTALLEKLQNIAEHLRDAEGWSWCDGRIDAISNRGQDQKIWRLLPVPVAEYNEAETDRLNALNALEEQYEEQGNDELNEVWSEQQTIVHRAELRAWTAEDKLTAGIVVSWNGHDVDVQRGVVVRASEQNNNAGVITPVPTEKTEPLDTISVPLLTRLSSERTLAVQAALLQQPQKAIALMVWKMCNSVFHSTTSIKHPFCISVTVSHYSLTREAPDGENGAAFLAIQTEKERLEALLPEGWRKDMTLFFTLNDETLTALMTFCTACSIDGVQKKDEFGRKDRSPLDGLETAIHFDLRDWWQPTKENLFTHLKQPQIIEALEQGGFAEAASDAGKMKKKDAAERAESTLSSTRWVPDWLESPENKQRRNSNAVTSLTVAEEDSVSVAHKTDSDNNSNAACAA
ncbi:ParB/RepB/Spo0J family partition protein [Klebsiella oxytoca]|uniref:ParB/RepB/Spo0J family partition protein n=1 Tax=Klebsiella oxytoca TaxID=571 RepID=UPI0034D260BE